MKVLACHSYYQQLGGENLIFDEETKMLEERGHTVLRYTFHNADVHKLSKLALIRKTIWNQEAAEDIRSLIRREKPDVMHCTNTFPLISPSVYQIAQTENLPVIQSLHNYRLLCPKALLMRNVHVCEDCLGKTFAWPGILHACYRDSRAASAIAAGMLTIHKWRGTWSRDVDLYITSTRFSRQKLIEGGLDSEKIVVKPNFVCRDPGVFQNQREDYIVFVGRLAPEKGIETLLAAWSQLKTNLTLKIVGEGPLSERVREAGTTDPRIDWLGERSWSETLDIIGRARCLVMPSIWYETFGRVITEAFSVGTPVLVSRLGAMAELVEEEQNGLLCKPRDPNDLLAKLELLVSDQKLQQRLRVDARRSYEEKYSVEVNYGMLIDIYERAILAQKTKVSRSKFSPKSVWPE